MQKTGSFETFWKGLAFLKVEFLDDIGYSMQKPLLYCCSHQPNNLEVDCYELFSYKGFACLFPSLESRKTSSKRVNGLVAKTFLLWIGLGQKLSLSLSLVLS